MQPTIDVNESILERINSIFKIAEEYGLLELIRKNLIINRSIDNNKIEYTLNVTKAKFDQYPEFQMKLEEKAYADSQDLTITKLQSYSFHGFHLVNPSKHFIRFDYEPFKEKYAPVHINADKQKWGDHLVFPDDTNLDISRMSCPIALNVFNRYAKNKEDFPTNRETNQPYVEIIENGG